MREQLKNKKVILAPLAGVSDVSFRIICESLGADRTFTEMVSAKGLYYNDKKTEKITYIDKIEKKAGIQIFGRDTEIMKNIVENKLNPRNDINEISVNMGCPAPKIVKNKEGSYLLKEPDKVYEILSELKKVSKKPLSLKYRIGFDDDSINFLEIGKIADELNLSSITLHGRTREQYYSGKANWECIKKLKESVRIPVFANGDVFSVEDFINIMEITNCDGVMIARGSMGNPFIFKQIKDFVNTGSYDIISPKQIIEMIKYHYKLELEFKEPRIAINQMRKHVGWYLKGLNGSNKIKNKINNLNNLDGIFRILDEYEKFLERK
ncbi:MAG: tRNA dihydrouridine synthase DusB [Tissierellia bacterium]|nr:tRNA dihydrouridine synthase DusB [Tissierellia bacterium]